MHFSFPKKELSDCILAQEEEKEEGKTEREVDKEASV